MRVKNTLIVLFILVACVNCSTPQRSLTSGNSLLDIGLRHWSNQQKNLVSRNFFRALGSNTNPSIATAVTSSSPRQWAFAPIADDFATRAAVPYRRHDANLLLGFDVLGVEGSLSGTHIQNYEVVVSVIRPNSLFGGDQIIGMRSARITCTTGTTTEVGTPLSKYYDRLMPEIGQVLLFELLANCDRFVPEVAEALLYDFAADYGAEDESS